MKRIFAIAMVLIAMTACTSKRTNPFFAEWNTPFGIPPFEQIQEADYLPALQEGIKQHDAEIAAIIANPEAPTFDNVIAAYDQSGQLLSKVVGVLFNEELLTDWFKIFSFHFLILTTSFFFLFYYVLLSINYIYTL